MDMLINHHSTISSCRIRFLTLSCCSICHWLVRTCCPSLWLVVETSSFSLSCSTIQCYIRSICCRSLCYTCSGVREPTIGRLISGEVSSSPILFETRKLTLYSTLRVSVRSLETTHLNRICRESSVSWELYRSTHSKWWPFHETLSSSRCTHTEKAESGRVAIVSVVPSNVNLWESCVLPSSHSMTNTCGIVK